MIPNLISESKCRDWYEKEKSSVKRRLKDSDNFSTLEDGKREVDKLRDQVNRLVHASPLILFISNLITHK